MPGRSTEPKPAYSNADFAILSRDWNDLTNPDGSPFGHLDFLPDVLQRFAPNGVTIHVVTYKAQDRIEQRDELGKGKKAGPTGGLDISTSPSHRLTHEEGWPTFNYGLSSSRASNQEAFRRKELPATQRFLYPKDFEIIRTVFKKFLWEICNNDDRGKGIQNAQKFLRDEALARDMSIEEAFVAVMKEFDEASRRVAKELVPNLEIGAIVDYQDLYWLLAVGHTVNEWVKADPSRTPEQISVNMMSHIPLLDIWDHVWDMGDEAPGLSDLGNDWLRKVFASLALGDATGVHIERYRRDLLSTREKVLGPLEQGQHVPGVTVRHVHLDSDDVQRVITSIDSPEVQRGARALQKYAQPLPPNAVVWLTQCRLTDAKAPLEVILGLGQYNEDIFSAFREAADRKDIATLEHLQWRILAQHGHFRLPDSYEQGNGGYSQQVEEAFQETNENYFYICEQMGVHPRGREFLSTTNDQSHDAWVAEAGAMGIYLPGEKAPRQDILVVNFFAGGTDGLNLTIFQTQQAAVNSMIAAMATIGAVEQYPKAAKHWHKLESNTPRGIANATWELHTLGVKDANKRMAKAGQHIPHMNPTIYFKDRVANDIMPEVVQNRAAAFAAQRMFGGLDLSAGMSGLGPEIAS